MAVDLVLAVTYFGILLGFGVLVANILEKRRIPDAFFLIILGLILGPTLFTNPAVRDSVNVVLVDLAAMGPIPDFIRLLAIIMIIFTGTFSLNLRTFKENSDIAIKLAVLGTIVTVAIVGFAAHFVFGLDPAVSILLGAVLAGTGDAVIFAFGNILSKYKNGYSVIWMEAIFNSPVTILITLLLLNILVIQPGGIIEPLKYASQFWELVAAGVGTGLILGFGVSKLLKNMLANYTPLLLFSIALITFALAENIGGSGILAVAVCGIIVGNITFPEKAEVKRFDDILSNLFRISIFTFLGAQAVLFVTLQEFLLVLVFFLVVFFARAVFIIPFLGKKRKEFTRKEMIIMTFATAKGLDSAVTAPIVAATLVAAGQAAVASRFVNIVVLIILMSILVSSAIAYFLGRSEPEDGIRDKKGKVRKLGGGIEVTEIKEK